MKQKKTYPTVQNAQSVIFGTQHSPTFPTTRHISTKTNHQKHLHYYCPTPDPTSTSNGTVYRPLKMERKGEKVKRKLGVRQPSLWGSDNQKLLSELDLLTSLDHHTKQYTAKHEIINITIPICAIQCPNNALSKQ